MNTNLMQKTEDSYQPPVEEIKEALLKVATHMVTEHNAKQYNLALSLFGDFSKYPALSGLAELSNLPKGVPSRAKVTSESHGEFVHSVKVLDGLFDRVSPPGGTWRKGSGRFCDAIRGTLTKIHNKLDMALYYR